MRMFATICIGVFSLILAILLAIIVGPSDIEMSQVLSILLQTAGIKLSSVPSWVEVIIIDIRLPRVLVAAAVGGSLAVAGCALQSMFQNPLADPGVIGISSGAALGAVCSIYFGLAVHSVYSIPLFSFLGALLTAWIVYRVASERGHISLATLLLAGIAVGTLAQSFVALILFFALEDFEIGRQIVFWTLGGIEGRTWTHVMLAMPICALGLLVIFAYARDLDALTLGEVHASAVGVDVVRTRAVIIVACAALVGGSVAVSGVIGFVGILIPHGLRLLLGPKHRTLLLASLFVGGIFLIGSDTISRMLLSPKELRLGIVTAAFGAPFFLLLLMRKKKEGLF